MSFPIPESDLSVAGFLTGVPSNWRQDVLQHVRCWVPSTLVVVSAQDLVDASAWIFHMVCSLCVEMLHG